ncbi:MAG: VanZ family protein [Acidobacteriota bacterium]
MRAKILASLYIITLFVIVLIADHKKYHHLFDRIRAVPYGDKIGHFLLMGTLALVVNILFSCKTFRVRSMQIFIGSLVVAVLVTIEEFSQLFIAYRTFDFGDLTADYLGILLFTYLAKYLRQKINVGFKESA